MIWTIYVIPSAEHLFETFLLTWVQNNPDGFFKKSTTLKKQYICRVMIMLCQWDLSEQIEKLVTLLLCMSKKCSR
jgi:hypothetical protein